MQNKIKVVLLGNTNIGKSTLLYRLTNYNYLVPSGSTIGVEFGSILYEDYKFLFWDTAGQERFRSIIRSYYRCVDIFILMYSINCTKSFKDLDNWITEINEFNNNPNSKIIIIANKIDLEKKRCISSEEGKQYALSKNVDFIEITCKGTFDYHNILDLLIKNYQESGRTNKSNHYICLDDEIKLENIPKSQKNSIIQKKCC